jgi:hypothetical protein
MIKILNVKVEVKTKMMTTIKNLMKMTRKSKRIKIMKLLSLTKMSKVINIMMKRKREFKKD